jgi:osmotically-inducible protein OsmY
MFRQVVWALLMSSALMWGQGQAQNQEPSVSSVLSSSGSDTQAQQVHDSVKASLQENEEANDQIQTNLQSALDGDPILMDSDVAASVDDETIILTGTVESYRQHQRVLELVSPYSASRDIVDNVKVH